MDPVIKKLMLKRFRSIPGEEVTFDNPTFVVGRNGSGKSNFVDAFAFLAEAMVSPLQAVFDKRGGITAVRNRTSVKSYPPNLGFGVQFGQLDGEVIAAHYAFAVKAEKNHGYAVVREQCVVRTAAEAVWFNRTKEGFTSNVSGLRPSLEPTSLGLPVIGGETRFAPILRTLAAMRVYSIQPAPLREMQDPDSGQGLRPDGSNTASVLQEIERQSKDDLRRIEEFLTTIVPSTKRVRPVKHGNKLALEFTQEWGEHKRLKFESFSMSDGTLRALGLLAAVFQHPTPSLIVIEEPEATMHPGALGAVMDLLRHAGRVAQLIVTTHSPDILDADWLEDRHLRIAHWQEGATRLTSVSSGTREALREHLQRAGELQRSNALRGLPTSNENIPQPNLFEEVAA
jgi:predicted ATPase